MTKSIFLLIFPLLQCKTSDGWQLIAYGSINLKRIMKLSFAQKNAHAEDWGRNPNFVFFCSAYSEGPRSAIAGLTLPKGLVWAEHRINGLSSRRFAFELLTIKRLIWIAPQIRRDAKGHAHKSLTSIAGAGYEQLFQVHQKWCWVVIACSKCQLIPSISAVIHSIPFFLFRDALTCLHMRSFTGHIASFNPHEISCRVIFMKIAGLIACQGQGG